MHTHTYTQVLAIITIGAGASSQSSVDVFQNNHPLPRNTDAAGGWLIFISFWVMLYQVIVILQRFLNFGIINNNITLFLILVSIQKWALNSLSEWNLSIRRLVASDIATPWIVPYIHFIFS